MQRWKGRSVSPMWWTVIGACLLLALLDVVRVLADCPPISLGTPVPDSLSAGAARYYGVSVADTDSLIVMVRASRPYYDYEVKVHQGSESGPEVGTRWQGGNEESIEVVLPAPGSYCIEVRNSLSGDLTFDLLANVRSAVTLTPGVEVTNQSLWAGGDVRYYKVAVTDADSLLAMLRGSDPYYDYEVTVHEGSITGPEVGTRRESGTEESVEVALPPAGDHYVEVRNSSPDGRTFTLLAEMRWVVTLTPGVQKTGQSFWAIGDVRYYKVTVTDADSLLAMLRGSTPYYDDKVTVRYGSLIGPEAGTRREGGTEESVEVVLPAAGDYYIEVRNTSSGGRSFTLLAEMRWVVTLTPGVQKTGQSFWAIGDVRYYKVTVTDADSLLAMLRGSTPYYDYKVTVRYGSLIGPEAGTRREAGNDESVEVVLPAAGDYYIEVRNTSSGSRSFTLLAVTRQVGQVTSCDSSGAQPLWARGDVYYYRASVTNSDVLYVLLQGSEPYYNYELIVYAGSIGGPAVGNGSQSGNQRSVSVTSPSPGNYYIEVRNASAGERTFNLNVDYNNAPVVTIISPQPGPGDLLRGILLIEADASDTEGIDRVEFFVDGGYKESDTTQPYQFAWDTRPASVPEGPHTILARAWDVCGRSAQDDVNVTVDNCTFDDICKPSSQLPYVEALVSRGITAGCQVSPPLYCPYASITRAQMAKFLCIAAGKQPLDRATPTFADVPKTNIYYGYVERLADAASWGGSAPTGGCRIIGSTKYFCPNDPVTREQMAKFLCIAAGKSPMASCAGTFGDVTSANTFCRFIERLTDPTSWPGGQAVTSGCAAGPPPLYCPKSNVTRGQMAVFLVRAFGIPL